MRLADDAELRLDAFFRDLLDEPPLPWPSVGFHAPDVARLLEPFGVVGLTLGRHVFVTPRLVVRGADGVRRLPARLVVHEVRHVMQYRRGVAGFLARYLAAWLAGLRRYGLSRRGRMLAYRRIPAEREARHAERCWSSRLGHPTRLALRE